MHENKNISDKYNTIVSTFKGKILKLEISIIHWKLNVFRRKAFEMKSLLANQLPEDIMQILITKNKKISRLEYSKTKRKQLKKFSNLKSASFNFSDNVRSDEKWFVNLTNIEFPENIKYLLSLGDKFNLPYSSPTQPLKEIIIDIEYILSTCNDEDSTNLARSSLINSITNFIRSKNQETDRLNNILRKWIRETKQFLKTNENIIITKADKSKTTVAIFREEYDQKALNILDDNTTYCQINEDPTKNVQSKLNKIVTKLYKEKKIGESTYKLLKCTNGLCPRIYFLPKIHKLNNPLRPIVSYIGSPLYNLSKYLAQLLNHAFEKDDRYTRNSFELVEYLKTVTIPDRYILISLDVVSLYTNVPLDLAITIIEKKWGKIEPHTTLSVEEFLQLFTFCIENSYFMFNDAFFRQIFGLGMGNNLAPVTSDIVMVEVQNLAIDKLSFGIPFFKRYVDDIITSIPFDKKDEILAAFNSIHPRLKFTIEIESHNNSLPFLDTLLIRRDNRIITDWYQKPTFSGRILNFNSKHHMAQKINIINNLKHRALKLSDNEFHEKNIIKIQTILEKNNYPTKFIKKILNKSEPEHHRPQEEKENQKYFSLTYVENLGEQIKNIFTRLNVNIAFKSDNTIKQFFTKTKSARISEHKRDSLNILNPLKNKKENNTALAEHVGSLLHSFNFDPGSVKILGRQTNLKKRLLDEMISIKQDENSINKRNDIEKLNTAYYYLIGKIKNK
ncbi:uncharacterized protein LOC123315739 [Coccinella septempunctata]|nr:uncharacterized protein LOC123315739 [Coccinella septempunctata]